MLFIIFCQAFGLPILSFTDKACRPKHLGIILLMAIRKYKRTQLGWHMSTNLAIHNSHTKYCFLLSWTYLISWPAAGPVWLIKGVLRDPMLSGPSSISVSGGSVGGVSDLFLQDSRVDWVYVHLWSGAEDERLKYIINRILFILFFEEKNKTTYTCRSINSTIHSLKKKFYSLNSSEI